MTNFQLKKYNSLIARANYICSGSYFFMQDREVNSVTNFQAIAGAIPAVDAYIPAGIAQVAFEPVPLLHIARITVKGDPTDVRFYDEPVLEGTIVPAPPLTPENGGTLPKQPLSKAERREAQRASNLEAMLLEIAQAREAGPVETRSGLTGIVHMRARLAKRRPI